MRWCMFYLSFANTISEPTYTGAFLYMTSSKLFILEWNILHTDERAIRFPNRKISSLD